MLALCCCSLTKFCLTLCNPMNCGTPGFPVLHHLSELAQTLVHWVTDAIQPSHSLSSSPPPALNLSQHQGFPKSQLFASGGQSIGASASASALPMDIQDWFPLGWTGSISLLTQRLSSSPTPQFKSMSSLALSLLYGPTHIHTWLLEKPQLYMDLGLQTNVSAF